MTRVGDVTPTRRTPGIRHKTEPICFLKEEPGIGNFPYRQALRQPISECGKPSAGLTPRTRVPGFREKKGNPKLNRASKQSAMFFSIMALES